MIRRPPTLRLKTRVMIALCALVGGTALAIVGYTDVRHRGSTLALAERLVEEAGDLVIERTLGFLEPAQRTTAVLADALADPAVGLDREERVSLMASLISVDDQLDSAFVADARGGLLQVRRGFPEASIARDALVLRKVVPLLGGARESFYRLQPGPPVTIGAMLTTQIWDYDPRQRPWYLAAVKSSGPVWTDPYRFSTTGVPGITATQALRAPSGALRGVVGADITLGALSEFLEEQSLGSGLTFLVGAQDRVVAHPNRSLFAASRGEALPGVDKVGVDGLTEALAAFRAGGPQTARLSREDDELLVRFEDLPEPEGVGLTLVIVASTEDFLGRSQETRRNAVLISLLILGLGVALSGLVSGEISRPMESLARKVARIRGLRFDNDFSVSSSVREVQLMTEALASMQAALQSFARYAPAGLVQKLMASGEVARLGGEEREVSVLFADIRSYATLTEQLRPADVVELLNVYFSAMQEVIEAHQGEVLEYAGDAILVVFGAPIDLPEHPRRAVECALAMVEVLARLNQEWTRNGLAKRWTALGVPEIRCGIGVHTGPVVAGNLGSRTHMKYGIVGDTVNVAARLEALNKDLDTSVLISEAVRALLPEAVRARAHPAGTFKLKGRGQATLVHAVR